MSNFKKYFFTFFLVYFVVDFTTGFNWDLKYWLLVDGPAIGLIIYSLSGLFFAHLIYKKNFSGWRLFFSGLAYGFVFEILVFRNALFSQNFLNGLLMTSGIYSLIIFLPKWIVEGELKANWKKAALLVIFWVIIAVAALLNNPHKI